MDALKEEVTKYKEDSEMKDTQISKYEAQVKELQSAAKDAKHTDYTPKDEDSDRDYKNIDASAGDDSYANIDVSAGDEDYTNINTTDEGTSYANINTSDLEKAEDTSQREEECGPEDYGAPYVNVKVDEDNEGENKDEKKQDEGEKKKDGEDNSEKKKDGEDNSEKKTDEDGFDAIAKTETLTSASQLSRAKVSTTIKRKPPSRGLLRRAAEESGSQGDLFGVGETEEGDYVNMPVNPAVREPTQKTKVESKMDEANDQPIDVKDDQHKEQVCYVFRKFH